MKELMHKYLFKMTSIKHLIEFSILLEMMVWDSLKWIDEMQGRFNDPKYVIQPEVTDLWIGKV